MAHVRQQLRDQAVFELSEAIPEFQSVVSSRLFNYREADFPACNVVISEEESAPMHLGAGGEVTGNIQKRLTQRVAAMNVEVYCTADADTIDDEMDRLAVEIEKVLGTTLLDNLASDIALSTTTMVMDSQGEIPIGIIALTWSVQYRTFEGDPETSIN